MDNEKNTENLSQAPKHITHIKYGRKLVYGYVVLLVLAAIAGLIGYARYHHHHNNPKTTTSSSTATVDTNKHSIPDPYTGWKTFTDTTYHYSFKYPTTDWTISTTTAQTTLLNSDKSIEVDYINPYPHDNALVPFIPVSITDLLDASLDMKIIGGLYDGTTPEYNVVEASLLDSEPLTIGRSSHFDGAPRFTDKGISYTGTFRARSTAAEAQTSAWFSTTDAKTSLMILQSFTYQQ